MGWFDSISSSFEEVKKRVANASHDINTGINNFLNDPGRVQTAFLTGGLSEQLRGVGGEAELYAKREMAGRAPKMAGLSDIEVPEPQAPIEDETDRRRAKGRSSTILTSTFGNARTARRTLLGA